MGELEGRFLKTFARDWLFWARDDQLPPPGSWSSWVLMGGRGAGKTRAGAEWVRGLALGIPPFAAAPLGRIALVAETFSDGREVMIEGVSGLLSIHTRSERPLWISSRRRLEWRNGAVAQLFSSEDPESLRGPQFHAAWCDELAKWRRADETFDMLQFGLRLGTHPRQVITTTPRAIGLLKRLLRDRQTVVTRAGTQMNAANLAPCFLDQIVGRYAGTHLGRQELEGELIEDRSDALWQRADLETERVFEVPDLKRIVVAIDPPASSGAQADACGLIVAGIDEKGQIYILQDASAQGLKPHSWAQKAVALYTRYEADAVVAEVNQGGEMVEAVLREVNASVPLLLVRATRGKYIRAEPIAALYAQGRVHHCGSFPELEDELCDFGPGGLSSGRSPDRLDALVWAVTELAFKERALPRVRIL